MSDDKMWFDRLSFTSAIKSLEDSVQQIHKARDDSYFRARAEAKNEAYELVIKLFIKELVERATPND